MTQHSIFIGYRREDTADASGRVYDRLVSVFGREAVFKDVDDLPAGADFGAYILTVLPKCRVFLAMIGPNWVDIRDEAGARRLDDRGDWVRIELETALKTPGLQIVPVLVNGAPMPRPDQLPECLQALLQLNAALVRRDPDFHKDMDKLTASLRAGNYGGNTIADSSVSTGDGRAALAWAKIEASLDPNDYSDFAEIFRNTHEGLDALKRKRQLETWAQVAKHDVAALTTFLQTAPFPALEGMVREAFAIAEQAQAAKAAARNAVALIMANSRAALSDIKQAYYSHQGSLRQNMSPGTRARLDSQDMVDLYYDFPRNIKDDDGEGLAIGYMEYMRFMLDLVLYGAITRAELPAVFMRFFEVIPQTSCKMTESLKYRMIGALEDFIGKVPDLV
jgi:hypothetical protein